MSDKPPQDPSLIKAGMQLGSQVASSLGPNFLTLVILMAAVMAVLFWFVDARARHTAELLNQLLAACLPKR